MKKIFFFLLFILITVSGCVAPKQMRSDGYSHKMFRCYGWKQLNHCSPYAVGLSLRFMYHKIPHRMVTFKTSNTNPRIPSYHVVVWFQYKGEDYIMDNEHDVPQKVVGANLTEQLRDCFGRDFVYLVGDTEDKEIYDRFWEKKHYDNVMKSFDKYKKSVILPQ